MRQTRPAGVPAWTWQIAKHFSASRARRLLGAAEEEEGLDPDPDLSNSHASASPSPAPAPPRPTTDNPHDLRYYWHRGVELGEGAKVYLSATAANARAVLEKGEKGLSGLGFGSSSSATGHHNATGEGGAAAAERAGLFNATEEEGEQQQQQQQQQQQHHHQQQWQQQAEEEVEEAEDMSGVFLSAANAAPLPVDTPRLFEAEYQPPVAHRSFSVRFWMRAPHFVPEAPDAAAASTGVDDPVLPVLALSPAAARGAGGSLRSVRASVVQASGQLQVEYNHHGGGVGAGAAGRSALLRSTRKVADGEWHHVSVTVQLEERRASTQLVNGRLTIYADGIKQNSQRLRIAEPVMHPHLKRSTGALRLMPAPEAAAELQLEPQLEVTPSENASTGAASAALAREALGTPAGAAAAGEVWAVAGVWGSLSKEAVTSRFARDCSRSDAFAASCRYIHLAAAAAATNAADGAAENTTNRTNSTNSTNSTGIVGDTAPPPALATAAPTPTAPLVAPPAAPAQATPITAGPRCRRLRGRSPGASRRASRRGCNA